MKALLLSFIALTAFASQALADDAVWPTCYVRGGKGYAQLCTKGSFSLNGSGRIYFYDADGEQIDDTSALWMGSAINGCDTVDTETAPSKAVSCYFQPGENAQ